MNIRFIILIAVMFCVLYSCKKEEEPKTASEKIIGKWYLKAINLIYTYDSFPEFQSKSGFWRIYPEGYGKYFSEFRNDGKVLWFISIDDFPSIYGFWGFGVNYGDLSFIYPTEPIGYKVISEDSIHFNFDRGVPKITFLNSFRGDTSSIKIIGDAHIYDISENHLLFSSQYKKGFETYKITYDFGK